MSDALPRNITLIGRLKKEWSRISRDIYSESYTSRQEIVPLDESTQAGVKEKPPLPGALISNGAAYRIRTYDVLIRSQTLYPAEVTPRLVDYYAHGLNIGQAFFQKSLHFFKNDAASIAKNEKETKTPLTQAANGAMMRAESMQSGKLCGKQKEFRRKNR